MYKRNPSSAKARMQALHLAAVFTLAILAAAALLLAALSATPAAAQPTGIGLVTDGPTVDDGGFNWLSYQGLLQAESGLGVVGTVYTSTSPADYETNLQQCVDDGNDLCISVGFSMADATWNVAQANPGTNFAIVDVFWDEYPGNLRGMTFAADQAGYLAGTLAGLMTDSDIVGDIGGMPIPPVDEFIYSYRNGARCANANADILIAYAGTFGNPDVGAQLAQQMMAEGADVIFAPAGPTGIGAVLTATQSAAWGMGVDTDWYVTVFMSGTVPGSDKLLSSAMKRIDNAVYSTISDVVDNTFSPGTAHYDLAAGGVGLAPFHETDPDVPGSVKDALAQTEQGIIDGSIDVNEPCWALVRYVDGDTGSDDSDCTDPADPCQTISYAVSEAQPDDLIYVAEGTYDENVELAKEVELYGGYSGPPGWNRDLTAYETIIQSASSTQPGEWDGNNISFPRVILDGGQYRMWYNGQNPTNPAWGWSLGLAESPDGLDWTKYGDNPVLGPGEGDQWDAAYRGQVSVMEDGGLYEMWYSGSDGGPWQTGYATSTDGIDWNIYGGNPVLPVGGGGSWDEQEANGPTVVKDGGLYEMWYHGCDAGYTICSIGYATSTNGVDWFKHPSNPVLTGTPGEWDENNAFWPSVAKTGGTYEMWYYGGNGQIGYATSLDGVNWTKHGGNPVLTEGWDGGGAHAHTVLREGGTYKMWLRSGMDSTIGIGYAESTDGISWTLSISNPLITPGVPGQWGQPVVDFQDGSDGAVLDGFTLTGGDTHAGGGLLIANGGSATVANCLIDGNQSQGWGGGVWVTNADATIRDSTISNNNSGGSGGIEVNHDYGPSHLTLLSTKVEYNVGGEIGGVQVWGDQASATVVGATFLGNEATQGGGIALNNGASIAISDTWIYSNTAHHRGGGVALREGSSATIHGTRIYGNTAESGEGGGIASESGDVHLHGSWVVGNVAQNNEGGGIAIGEGGSFYGENCVVAGNTTASAGGGFWLTAGGPFQLVNCDIVGNEAGGEGGALAAAYSAQVEVTNTLIISNMGASGIGDRDSSGSTFLLNYCDTYGNSPDGTNDVTIVRTNCLGTPPEDGLDPRFGGGTLPGGVGPGFADQWLAYDYHLQGDSPAIDAGTPDGAPATDIGGTTRDSNPDMGAYEWVESLYRIFLPIVMR